MCLSCVLGSWYDIYLPDYKDKIVLTQYRNTRLRIIAIFNIGMSILKFAYNMSVILIFLYRLLHDIVCFVRLIVLGILVRL